MPDYIVIDSDPNIPTGVPADSERVAELIRQGVVSEESLPRIDPSQRPTEAQLGRGLTRSRSPIRSLTAQDLDIEDAVSSGPAQAATSPDPAVSTSNADMDSWDERAFMDIVKALLFEDGGVILSGPPGTSKSYYADLVAHDVAGDETRVKSIQFHPSYQYEDFMEGYLPDPKTGSFSLKPRHFLEIVNDACLTPDENFVLVIDEISRADPARVFGEALTYVEKSKRGKDFYLASGTQAHIPENLYIIATMNPFDRGVEDVDAAFERRFPRVRMDPDEHILRKFLRMNEVDEGLADRVVTFFKRLQSEAVANPAASLGHAFFLEVTDGASLQRLWDHRLSFFIDRGFPLDVETRQSLTQMWQNYVLGGGASSGPDETVSGE